MKKINVVSLSLQGLLFLGILAGQGCEKGAEGENGDDKNHHMTARIDGQSFVSDRDQLGAVHDEGYLVITGATENEQEIITFQMFDFPGQTGTYSLGTGEFEALCFYSDEQHSFYILDDIPGSTGSLVITEITSTGIKGTFHFTGYTPDSEAIKQVTDGSFFMPVYDTPR